jgi:oligopeptide transport system substrate-binding protein
LESLTFCATICGTFSRNVRISTSSPNSQLAKLFALAFAGVGLLMVALHYAGSALSGDNVDINAIDEENNSVSIIIREEPPQLNSSRATDSISGMVLGHVMEGLVRMGLDDRLEGAVAQRWEVTPTHATFWLRDNAKWSDGEPVTAADFIFAWQTALKPETASQYAFLLFAIKNAQAVNNGELSPSELGVTAPDPYTLIVELERPVPFFDKMLVFPTFLPIREDFYNATQGRFGADADQLLYNGPFQITRWVHGASMTFERNPHFWNQDEIHLDTIHVPYITSDATASLNFFKDSKIATTGLQAENLTEAMRLGWQIRQHRDGVIFYMEFNHRPQRVTANLSLRRAMQLVLDMDELVYKVTKLPGYEPGVSLFPGWLMGESDLLRKEYPSEKVRPNRAQAKAYLQQALQELGLQRPPTLVLLAGDNPISNIQSEWVQQTLKAELGIEVKIDKQIFKQRLAKMTSGDFDFVLAGWGPDYADPLTFGDLFASWNKNNRGQYNSPELDALIYTAQSRLEPGIRMRAFGDIQQHLHENAVILPMYERGVTYVVDPRLRQLKRRVIGPDPDLSRAYIDAGGQ